VKEFTSYLKFFDMGKTVNKKEKMGGWCKP